MMLMGLVVFMAIYSSLFSSIFEKIFGLSFESIMAERNEVELNNVLYDLQHNHPNRTLLIVHYDRYSERHLTSKISKKNNYAVYRRFDPSLLKLQQLYYEKNRQYHQEKTVISYAKLRLQYKFREVNSTKARWKLKEEESDFVFTKLVGESEVLELIHEVASPDL